MKKAFMDLKALKMKVIYYYILGNHFPKDTSSYARRLEIFSPKGLQEKNKKLPG
jgi:hypothetical protein